jgi:hypothetical protein
MKIEKYSFGLMIIESEQYTSDLVIYPNAIDATWWRKQGHRLLPEDLEDILVHEPEKLIIGTGFYGLMKIDKRTIKLLKEKSIKLFADNTRKAVEKFNSIKVRKDVIAAFHLTC